MRTFENIDELKSFLQRDQGRKSSTPVRFVNVDSLADWRKLNQLLHTLTPNFVYLSEYCSSADILPNARKLSSDLRKAEQSLCVLPLSEFLRLSPAADREAVRFLNLYKGTSYAFRIYFPFYRLRKLLLALNENDPRQREAILLVAPKAADDNSLTVIQSSMQLKTTGEHIDGFKQYLRYWEKSPQAASVTLYTGNAVHLQGKKFFADVTVIADAFDWLQHTQALPAEFKRNYGDSSYWEHLADLVATAGSFEKAFLREFKLVAFNKSVFKNFGRLSRFRRWFLWLRCKLQGSDYVARCAKAAATQEEFVTQIYEFIFACADDKQFEVFCNERREVLSLMKTLPPETFPTKIRQADKKLALKILTDNSYIEKGLIFETLQKFKFNEYTASRTILHSVFPVLANYLADGKVGLTAEQAEYFRHYRWLKVTNQLTEEFNRLVKTTARDRKENVYALESRNKIVSEEYDANTAIFFVDGLGVEYMNFLVADFALLEEKFCVTCRVGRCNLPSVTELNKDFLQGRNIAGELLTFDVLKHERRTYPENLLSELAMLPTLKERILQALNLYEKVILCSDHGSSRLAVLARQTKFDSPYPAEGRTVYKSGRFAEALADDAHKFATALEHDGKTILADYSRFAQKGSPGNELHGGATLEEILVPVISIRRRTGR